jgi:HAD superfamily hydrolase (TIGR01549 family)
MPVVPEVSVVPEVPAGGGEIRAVVFDVDGTLYRQGPVRRAMVTRLARAHWRRPRAGLHVTRVLAAYRRAQESLRTEPVEGDLAAAQAERASLQVGVDVARVQACVDEWMETAPLDLVAASARAGLVDALDSMARSGVRLGVVSDYPARRKLQVLGVADRFEVVVSAQDERVQALKPSPKGILVALRELGVEPLEAVYVGDREDVDAPAAAAAGVRCVLIGESRSRPRPETPARVSDFSRLSEIVRRG